MISNDVYLAGSDGWELYKRVPLPFPLLGGPWVRGALASAPAGKVLEVVVVGGEMRSPRSTEPRVRPTEGRWEPDGGEGGGVRRWPRAPSVSPPSRGAGSHGGIKRVTIRVIYSEYYQALHPSLPVG